MNGNEEYALLNNQRPAAERLLGIGDVGATTSTATKSLPVVEEEVDQLIVPAEVVSGIREIQRRMAKEILEAVEQVVKRYL